MGGNIKIFTYYVMAFAPQSPCSKSKTQVNVSAATPTLCGHLLKMVSMLVIVVRCCLICLAKGTFQTKVQAGRYGVATIWGLVLLEVEAMSYVQLGNHSMVKGSAVHREISLVIVFQLMKQVKTCLQTIRMNGSQ